MSSAAEASSEEGDPPLARSRLRLPRALQWALGVPGEGGERQDGSDELPPEEDGDVDEQAPEPSEEEDDGPRVRDEGREPLKKKRIFSFSWRQGPRASEGSVEEPNDDDDGVDTNEEPPGRKKEKKQRVSLFQKLKRKREADEERIGLFPRLMAQVKKRDSVDAIEEDPSCDDADDEVQETQKSKRPGLPRRHKRAKKADLADEEAQKEFAEKANYDGYYDDVRPADYGETDEERGPLDIKAIALLVVGLIIFCVVAIKLQSML